MEIDGFYIKPPMKAGAMQYADGSVGPYEPGREAYNPDIFTRQMVALPYAATDPYEIVALSVVSALGKELMRIFPGMPWHRETMPVNLLTFPHNFVYQLTMDMEAERRNNWWLNYLATIRYRHVSDPSQSLGNLQESLDGAALKLMGGLENIYWGDIPIEIRNPRTEKVDGVLHWFGNITVMATKPVEEVIKMLELKQVII